MSSFIYIYTNGFPLYQGVSLTADLTNTVSSSHVWPNPPWPGHFSKFGMVGSW